MNHFPISVEQIATAMGNASSALAAAGNDFEHSIALLTAANATVQDASKSSTALRTMASRIRKTDVDVEDGEAFSVAKYDEMVQALTRHNVALTEANGEYRSTYEILKDISGVWSDLSNVEQAALADTIAGTRQQTVFYSLIENFNEAEKALDAMGDSAGALAESYDVYLGTAQAHIEQLKAAWQTFSMDAVNSSTVKGFVDVGTAILKVADSLAKVNRLLPTLLGAFTAFKGLKLAKSVLEQKVAVEALVASIAKEGTMTKSLSIDFERLNSVQRQQVTTQLQAAAASGEDAAQKALEVLGVESLTVAEGGATVATDTLNVSLKALAASNPFGWVMLGVSVLVTAIMYIKSFADSAEDTTRSIADMESELKQLGSESSRIASDYRNLKQSADEVIPKFVELSRGVNEYGENVSLTDEQYKEFISLNNQIADLIPGINLGYDSNGNAIIDLKDRADMLAESLWGAVEAQRALSTEEIARSTKDAFDVAAEITERKQQNAKIAIDVLNAVLDVQNELDFAFASDAEKQARVYQSIQDALSKYADVDAAAFDSILRSSGVYELEKYDDYLTVLERVRHETENAAKSTSEWTEATKGFVASAQTLVDDPLLRDTVANLVSGIDISTFNTDDGYLAVQTYIDQNIIAPINNMGDEAHEAISNLLDVKGAFLDGNASAYEYSKAIDDVSNALNEAGVSGKLVDGIMKSFGADVFSAKIQKITSSIKGLQAETDEFISGLSADDIEIVYKIINENGSMTLDELRAKMIEVGDVANEVSSELDIGALFKDLSSNASAIDKVTDAMKKLSKGTALTTKELTDLVKQYPELLKESNLYTDGSIEGQRRLLEVCLQAEQEKYNAAVDAAIKTLNVRLKELQLEMAAKMAAARMGEGDLADAVAAAKLAQDTQEMIENLEHLKETLLQQVYSEVEKIDSGYYDTSSSSTSSSSNKSEGLISLEEWYKVKTLIESGQAQIDYVQFIYELMDKIQRLLSEGAITAEEAAKYIKEYQKAIEDFSKNAEKAINDLVQYRIKQLKAEKEEEKQNLKDKLSDLKDFYNKQKDMLEKSLNEEKYLRDQAEKRKAVSEIQAQIDALQDDNSAWAQKKIAELNKKLDEEQKKLDEFESEHAIDMAKDFLDEQYDAQEKEINAMIESIDEYLNDPKALYNQALADIQSNSEAIYEEMKAYGDATSTDGKNAFVELWEAALEAIAAYEEFQNLRPAGDDANYYTLQEGDEGYQQGYDGTVITPHEMYRSADGRMYRIIRDGVSMTGVNAPEFLRNFVQDSARQIVGSIASTSAYNIVKNSGGTIVINTGDIIVQGNADEKTVSEIRRAQRESVRELLMEFDRLKR